MFDTSFFLFLKALLINIFLPLIPGVLFFWLTMWNKIKWINFYLVSWFLWIWMLSYSIFNLQFFYSSITIISYFLVVFILILLYLVKIYFSKVSFLEYFKCLRINSPFLKIINSFKNLKKWQKIFWIIMFLFIFFSGLISLLYTSNFPSYADDSFWNWNASSINIYYDKWIKLFWDKTEILWRWRIWYPIFFSIYKAMFSQFFWSWNDIFIKQFQWLIVYLGLLFIFSISFERTKSIFYALIPCTLILWLPLTFFHSVESYMELSSTFYTIFCLYYLFLFLETRDYQFLTLWTIFWLILSNIKNEWLIVYLPWVIIPFFGYIILKWEFKIFFISLFRSKIESLKIWLLILYYFIPFLIVRLVNNLSLNPVWKTATDVWITKIHSEIFPVMPVIFFNEDNYNIFPILIILCFIFIYQNRKKIYILDFWPIIPWLVIFTIFFVVFLITDNYKWVLDQTTVNRVFTTSFIIFWAFSSIVISKLNEK